MRERPRDGPFSAFNACSDTAAELTLPLARCVCAVTCGCYVVVPSLPHASQDEVTTSSLCHHCASLPLPLLPCMLQLLSLYLGIAVW